MTEDRLSNNNDGIFCKKEVETPFNWHLYFFNTPFKLKWHYPFAIWVKKVWTNEKFSLLQTEIKWKNIVAIL